AMGPAGERFIDFPLKEIFPKEFISIRVSGIGLTCGIPGSELAVNRLQRFAAVVFPPRVPNLFSPKSRGSSRPRAPIVIENVAVHDPATPLPAQQPDSVMNL